MGRKGQILIIVSLVVVVPIGQPWSEKPAVAVVLPDGFVLRGADGKVHTPDNNDVWLFKSDSDITDGTAVAEAGTSLRLLPSSTLERMTGDLKMRSAADYRLWGRVTRYKGKNFIFPVYFLPLSKIRQILSEAGQKPQGQKSRKDEATAIVSTKKKTGQVTINEPNDVLAIPQEIIERLKTGRTDVAKWPGLEEGPEAEPIIQPPPVKAVSHTLQQDSILADRTAVLRKDAGQLVFVLDALGRNAPQISLRLLPCEILELTEQRLSGQLEPIRFKIAGIVTEYKGSRYLLLHKAMRSYSHGNFAR